MRAVIDKFLHYLRYERNASPHTQRNYQQDLEQFLAYLTPPGGQPVPLVEVNHHLIRERNRLAARWSEIDRKSTRLNSSHLVISYAVFCLKKKKKQTNTTTAQNDIIV